jgi:glutaredoxin
MAKEFFKENNIPFEEYNVAADLEKRKEMMQKTGQMGVPVIDIDGSVIIGFDKEVIAKKVGIIEGVQFGGVSKDNNHKMAA